MRVADKTHIHLGKPGMYPECPLTATHFICFAPAPSLWGQMKACVGGINDILAVSSAPPPMTKASNK